MERGCRLSIVFSHRKMTTTVAALLKMPPPLLRPHSTAVDYFVAVLFLLAAICRCSSLAVISISGLPFMKSAASPCLCHHRWPSASGLMPTRHSHLRRHRARWFPSPLPLSSMLVRRSATIASATVLHLRLQRRSLQ